MKCPTCAGEDIRVRWTRGERRGRECAACRHRWTTVEVPEARHRAAESVVKAALEAAAALDPSEA
jgi:transcriptional regulator NrdR family protein